MTTDVVTVDEEAPLSRVAALMLRRGVKRLPVMREGRLVGIISRRDLLRAIITAKFDDTAPGDDAIRRSVLTRLGDIGETGAQLSVTVSNT